MVHLSTRLILSSVILFAQVSYLKASKCCEGDYTCSHCWLCKGSELRECWDNATAEIDGYTITDDSQQSVNDLCKGYSKLAKCWQAGRCCSEFSPLLTAAANLCNLGTWGPNKISKEELESNAQIAYDVRNRIWHNNSGKDVPKLSISVKAYNTDSSESSQADSYHPQSTDHNQHEKSTKTLNSYFKKSTDSIEEHSESDEKVDRGRDLGQKKTISSYSSPPKLEPQAGRYTQPKDHNDEQSKSVHHQAKCASKPQKCQTKTAEKYHNARTSHSHRSISKRNENPLYKRSTYPELFKRTAEDGNGCGLDFQGVLYPKEIPETVAKVFAEL